MGKIRVKARPPARESSPCTPLLEDGYHSVVVLPQIGPDDEFKEIVRKLSIFFADEIELPSSFEQLRTTSAGQGLRMLVDHLSKTCNNPAIVNALLSLRWHYAAEREHRGLSEARANACEIVAWRFLSRQSDRDAVDYCLYEIRGKDAIDANPVATLPYAGYDEEANERSPLLGGRGREADDPGPLAGGRLRVVNMRAELQQAIPKLTLMEDDRGEDPRGPSSSSGAMVRDHASFKNLNALQVAVVADAKRFLGQHIVQKMIEAIWHGDIVFWDTVSAYSTREPRYYNPRTADPYSRLRVPKYLKAWEVAFFAIFLVLYYSVVVERSFVRIPPQEVLFYFWLASFLWDEFQEWTDAGVFYLNDIFNIFDVLMIVIGVVFAFLRIIGISYGNDDINDIAFDVLSLEALLLVPRICSFLSLSPYWGTLIPCLREMGKDFLKFMVFVVIIYLGFLTSFTLVARDTFTVGQITWDITEIFYGNTGIGFQIMDQIDRSFGPPLMILFITLSSILLTGSLTGMLSNSFGRVMAQAREEYLYFYSVYVLEASTSSRLTHFYPPFNLVALVFFRPWQIIFAKDDRFRHGRIVALKATHFPLVAAIVAYEWVWRRITRINDKGEWAGFEGTGRTRSNSEAPPPPPGSSMRGGYKGTGGSRQGNAGGAAFKTTSQSRRLSDQLSPGARPSRRQLSANPRSVLSATDDEDDHSGPSNAELLKRIDQLTTMVTSIQEQLQKKQGE